ncbi:MAG: mannose-1-phosphate guanylyltransferase/mannose-6-phosphate isomerase [Alphaproteobacteria bacterium]
MRTDTSGKGMPEITPVLLAGGSGTRLWPLSRQSYPKQFSSLIGDQSLFQQSALRLSSSSSLAFSRHVTLTNADFRFIVGEQLHAIGVQPGPILIEPEGKNTAPAILAASLYAMDENPDAILLVAPSDHVIPDVSAFHAAVQAGLEHIANSRIVTFGIVPDRPETGYGYLELATPSVGKPVDLKRFVEKPALPDAKKMLEAGNFLWNAGIFMFRAKDMIAAFEAHAPNLIEPVGNALRKAKSDLDFLRLDPDAWSKCENISIDYAVMEKAENLVAVPFSAGWSDLGDWDAVWKQTGPDENGVVTSEGATAIDCQNSLLRSESESLEIVGIGLDNMIAVAMADAVLVAPRGRAQDVKQAVSALAKKDASQAKQFPKDHRPWGWFETLIDHANFKVKRIQVNPGAALSLQSHKYRSEHWVVVEGTALVTIGDTETLLSRDQSVYIPQGAIHRMANPGEGPMILIEVQTGTYFGEDDIIRYDDIYARG